MTKKEYISPTVMVEVLEEDNNLMFTASYTRTTSYVEDPSKDDDDYIHIHPNPIDPPEPIDDDDDY